MNLVLHDGQWAIADRSRQRGSARRLLRLLEWLLPWATRVRHGRYFSGGLERAVCKTIHRAASRGTLYSFAPPPPLTRIAKPRGPWPADAYRFRSPFVSHIPERNQAFLRHYRCGVEHRPLVIFNHGTGSWAASLERSFVRAFLAAGVDVATLVAPGFGSRRRGRQSWAETVGAALSAMVQLVHENAAVESWARRMGYRTVVVAGIGLGGVAAAVLAATTARFDAYVPMLAGAHPGRLWLPPRTLARAVDRRALTQAGVHHARALARLFDPVAPNRLPRPRTRRRCTVVGLRFDTLVPPDDVRDLAAHWGVVPVWLPRCHVELPACARQLAAIVVRATREVAA